MKQPQRYTLLCPGALAFAFGVLALFAALAMGTPATFGMGSMMWGAHDALHGPMGVGAFGLVTIVWTIAVGALGGVITAWTYNAIVGEQAADTGDIPPQAQCFTLGAAVTSPLPSRLHYRDERKQGINSMLTTNHSQAPGWPFPAKVAFAGFLAIALFFLWMEHRAHLFAYWPFLFVLACPLMHVFMHHGGGHESSPSTSSQPDGTVQ